ncbi:MAG: glycerol kinase GlpK [Actinomycetia bacterium]|nr:glycerol kinase GlpK [Actinomycetes bacterium]
MAWVISIDAGTTGVRSFAIDDSGVPGHVAHREFTQHFPQPGWVEHDAEEIWQVTQATLAEVVDAIGGQPIAAIGITVQRETIVAWDARDGRPLHRAIVWQDRRTAQRCEDLEAAGELDRVRSLTGLVLDPYFSASKIEWLLRHGGVEADQHLRLGTIDSWLLWNLTGGEVHATDVSNAARTMLFDIRDLDWSDDLCDLFGVPRSALPDPMPCSGTFGTTSDDCAAGAGIAVSGMAGDQQAALFGQACLEPGMAKNTYGTGSFVLMNVGNACPEPTDGMLSTVAWQLPGSMLGSPESTVTHYALEGAVFSTGSAVQWLRDGLGIIGSAAETGPLAESVQDSGGVVLVPAFTGLGSPWWDPRARGTIVGITRGTNRAHIARAVVESMVHQTRDVVDAMTAASGRQAAELRVDGGAAVMDLLCQLQADQLGVTVARAAQPETTALGAAYLAGLGVGVWADATEVSASWSADRRFEPTGDADAIEAAHATWHRGVERSLDWATD